MITKKFDAWALLKSNGSLIGAKKVSGQVKICSLEPSSCCDELFSFGCTTLNTISAMGTCSNGNICLMGDHDNNQVLELYETKYWIKVGQFIVNDPVLQLSVVDDKVYLACKTSILIVPIQHKQVLISQLVTGDLSDQNEIKLANCENLKTFLGISETKVALGKMKKINRKLDMLIKNRFGDISEEIIVQLFDFCTKAYLNVEDNEFSVEIKEELKLFFESFVKLPFNDVFMVSCFKSSTNMTSEQFMTAINWLLDMKCSKNEAAIFTWLSVLVDVNFVKLVLTPNQNDFESLHRMYDHIESRICLYEEMGTVKAMFDSLIEKQKSFFSKIAQNETRSVGQYSIELLSFSSS